MLSRAFDPILAEKIANAVMTDAGFGVVLLMGLVAFTCGVIVVSR